MKEHKPPTRQELIQSYETAEKKTESKLSNDWISFGERMMLRGDLDHIKTTLKGLREHKE